MILIGALGVISLSSSCDDDDEEEEDGVDNTFCFGLSLIEDAVVIVFKLLLLLMEFLLLLLMEFLLLLLMEFLLLLLMEFLEGDVVVSKRPDDTSLSFCSTLSTDEFEGEDDAVVEDDKESF